ncbi:PorT family protein [Chitinophaga pendula]|uniref:porin family protein n=1 Tax=Chitinophaga TaxID=79328 RepID=UPI000BAF77A8|nr:MULTISPECIES: porin family protein [Chitinophaga]ASZ10475.1 hypothetical protein CK934_05535 [Chitinophaga sp. MD30]UCJ06554.1 PorT family protein [Chitinophaga pendula]
MKKFTLVLLPAILFCYSLKAQWSLGLRVGYAGSSLHTETVGNKTQGDGRLDSYQMGLMLDVPLGNNMYIQSTLSYITKGGQLEQLSAKPSGVYLPEANEVKLRYLELPVLFVYKVPLGFGKLTVGAGPYAGYGLDGKYNLAIRYNGSVVQSSTQDISFSGGRSGIMSTDLLVKRWDAGAYFQLGLELNKLVTLHANYSYGLVDIDAIKGNVLKNRTLGITLGVLLSREDY